MTQRTTLTLDESSRRLLAELAEVYGSQSAAVREAVAAQHAMLARRAKRQAFIDDLVELAGEPNDEDRNWARRVAVEAAAASVAATQ
jgi:translation initiation factor 2 alpha subunit (eIF-2alpha)